MIRGSISIQTTANFEDQPMTLGDLREFVQGCIDRGMTDDHTIRVRTRMRGSTREGALVRAITATNPATDVEGRPARG